MVKTKTLQITVVAEKDKDGYFAYCPQFMGCRSEGQTYEEVIRSISDTIKSNLQERLSRGDSISTPELISVATLHFSLKFTKVKKTQPKKTKRKKYPANWERHFARIRNLPKPVKELTFDQMLELTR